MDLSQFVCGQCSATDKVQLSSTKQISRSGAAPTRQISCLSHYLPLFNFLLQMRWNSHLHHFLTRDISSSAEALLIPPPKADRAEDFTVLCHVSRLHPQLSHAWEPREQSRIPDTSSVAIRACGCVCSASAAPEDDAHGADGSKGSLGQSWTKAANSINPSLVRLPLTLLMGYTSGCSAPQPCLAQGLESIYLVSYHSFCNLTIQKK